MIANSGKQLDWVLGCIVITFLVSLFQIGHFYQNVGQKFGGFLAYYHPLKGNWYVDPQTPPWWSGLKEGGLLPQDLLLDWGELPYSEEQQEVYNNNQKVTVQVIRENGVLSNDVAVQTFTLSHLIDMIMCDLLTTIGFWLLAIVVYINRPTEPFNWILAALFCFAALQVWITPATLFQTRSGLDLAVFLFNWAVVLPMCGALMIHLPLLFPIGSRYPQRRTLYGIYGITMTLGSVFGVCWGWLWLSGMPASAQPILALFLRGSFLGIATLLIIGLITIAIQLGWTLYRANPRYVKRQARIFLITLAIVSLYVILVVGRMVSVNIDITFGFWKDVDLSYTLLVFPIATTIVFLRYQTRQKTRSLVLVSLWLVIIIGVSGIMASIVYAIFLKLSDAEHESPFILIFIPILITSLLWYSQVHWTKYFGRLLHWEDRSYDVINHFRESLIQKNQSTQLPVLMAETLIAELELQLAAIWLWDKEKEWFQCHGQAGRWKYSVPAQLPITHDEWQQTQHLLAFRLDDPDFHPPHWLKPLVGLVEIVVPLRSPQHILGIMALGKRRDGEVFDQRDLKIIHLITQQASLLLLSAQQMEELRRIPRLLEEAQEQEREKIAQELHDSVQQFFARLPISLETIRLIMVKDPRLAIQLYRQILEDCQETAWTVHAIQSNLTAAHVDRGLIQPISHQIEQMRQRCNGVTIKLIIGEEVDQILLKPARYALYRVIGQALDNIATHAQATEVKIALSYQDGKVYFLIQDNGKGSSAEEREMARQKGHLGLVSMRTRIQNLEGEFQFESKPNAGTKINGWLPISENNSLIR